MSSVITVAFENWKAQEAATGKPVLLNEFVFANVPGLDPAKPIDRNEKLPPENQIVHRQAVNKAGLASENAVAYSVTLGAEVGNFDFNWIGLLNKESGTIAMITHAPTQKKLKTQDGQQGNVLTRSFLLEFQGAAKETQITTNAETWQIDFTARLSGMDEMQRLINVDNYGAAAFFNDGFEVTRSGEQYTVKKGLGYVGGLRGQLEQNQILNGLRNTKIYADFSYQGNIVSQWSTVIKITAVSTLSNYVDAAGFTHQVFAIASIDTSGNVKDLRPMGALNSQEISALETRFKLDLSKKIDKANITNQTGNSSELVASQQLLTTELGKKQPAGTYVTPTDLNSGLDKKLDKTGGGLKGNNGVLYLNSTTENQPLYMSFFDATSKRLGFVGRPDSKEDIALVNSVASSALRLTVDNKLTFNNVEVLRVGDFGLGAPIPLSDASILGKITTQGCYIQIYAGPATTDKEYPYNGAAGTLIVYKTANNFTLQEFRVFNNASHIYYRYILSNGTSINIPWILQYNTGNTTVDRNGNLRVSGADSLSDYPVGAPIPWPQGAPPDGYLVCYGQSFNKSTYPLLAKAYPSGSLPDMRAEFIRGLDVGRGIDANRTVLSAQSDENKEHSHDIILKNANGGGSSEQFALRTLSINVFNGKYTTEISGGKESRPRNIAFLYIVRAA